MNRKPAVDPAEIAGLSRQGVSDAEMAERYGLSIVTIRKLRRRGGVKLPPFGTKPEWIREAVVARAAEGWPVPEIMAEFPVKRAFVEEHAKEFVNKNGRDWRSVIRWGQENCPDLMESLRRTNEN